MNWEELIKEDRIEANDDLYTGVMKRVTLRKEQNSQVVFRKRHIGLSIAAGILLGVLFGGVFHISHSGKKESAEAWYKQFYTDDAALECIELRLFE